MKRIVFVSLVSLLLAAPCWAEGRISRAWARVKHAGAVTATGTFRVVTNPQILQGVTMIAAGCAGGGYAQGAASMYRAPVQNNYNPAPAKKCSPPTSQYSFNQTGTNYSDTATINTGKRPVSCMGDGHWITENHDGKILELEDGSLWQVSDLDQVTSMLWLPVSDITVAADDDVLYPYKLTNTDDNEAVNAKQLH